MRLVARELAQSGLPLAIASAAMLAWSQGTAMSVEIQPMSRRLAIRPHVEVGKCRRKH